MQISGSTREDFAGVQDDCKISQPEGHHFAAILLWFRSLRNWPSTSCDRIPMALTSSFKLRIVHHLKHWISDFLSFETTYSMHKLSSRKCSKSVQQFLSSWMLHVRFLSFSSLQSWFAYGKGLWSFKALVLHVNELPISLLWIP